MNINTHLPLISCICITDRRPGLLLKAIASYSEQSYTHKELIISYPEEDLGTKNLIEKILSHYPINIVQIRRADEESIGHARNIAINQCNGEYVCMWDDDDIYYPTRIKDQYEALMDDEQKWQGSILTRIILYEASAKRAFLSFPSYWACTILVSKGFLITSPCEDRNEFEYFHLIQKLQESKQLKLMEYTPSLYAFVYHGGNVMRYSVFLGLIDRSEALQAHVSEDISQYLNLKVVLPD